MKTFAAKHKWEFPYLIDETQEVAKAYGAACTPDFFLFDGEGKLFYAGQFDETRPKSGEAPHGKDLEDAIDRLLSGETPPGAAIDGLAKSLDEVPAAPTTRLMLGSALTKDEDLLDARRILLPVAEGPFDSPEKPQAKQLLSNITGKPVALNDVPRR